MSFSSQAVRVMKCDSFRRTGAALPRADLSNLGRRCFTVAFVMLWLVRPTYSQTEFSYQGRLDENGSPAIGVFDMRFRVYDEPIAGNPISVLVTKSAVPVDNGLFTTELDFLELLPAGPLYLEIGVRRLSDPFTTLSPRQQILPTPLAGYALSGSLTGITSGAINQLPGPLVGIAEANPIATLHVQQQDLSIDVPAIAGDDLIIEAADAVLGLYSNSGGGFGSGMSLAEVGSGGVVTNKWLLIRETTTGGNGLRFVFGPGNNPGGAAPALYLDDTNRVGVNTTAPLAPLHVAGDALIDGIVNLSPRTRRLHIPASAFRSADSANVTVIRLTNANDMLGLSAPSGSTGAAIASVPLPDGAVITDIMLTTYHAGPQNTTLSLYREDYSFPIGGSVLTSIPPGSAGYDRFSCGVPSDPANRVADTQNIAFTVKLTWPGGTDDHPIAVEFAYTVDRIEP